MPGTPFEPRSITAEISLVAVPADVPLPPSKDPDPVVSGGVCPANPVGVPLHSRGQE